MNATLTHQTFASLSPATSARPAVGAAAGGPLVLLRLEGGAALLGATLAYGALGGRWGLFAALFLLPDLGLLGYLVGRRFGAASYNAAHSTLGPALLAALGASLDARGLLLGACIWAAHVGFDRMLGYGLKYATAFGDTHLGRREPRRSPV
jgi:hypothetical protein